MLTDRFLERFFSSCAAVALFASATEGAMAAPASRGHVPHASSPFVVLHDFAGPDGANPQGALVATAVRDKAAPSGYDEVLYGATQFGGAANDGDAFDLNLTSGAFAVAHSFTGVDGAMPSGGLFGQFIDYGILPFAGVTASGGRYGFGTAYLLRADGTVKVLHNFRNLGDGGAPLGRLVLAGGKYYGTTSTGALGFGTVFAVKADGELHTIHAFTGNADGGTPLAGLALLSSGRDADIRARKLSARATTTHASTAATLQAELASNVLYGTTSVSSTGAGTIYAISASGAFRTLYTFTNGADGATPAAELTPDFRGNLFGTASSGGSVGLGTVFELHDNGAFSVVHDFSLDSTTGLPLSGATPLAPVTVAFNGALYGTTSSGGANSLGNVWEIAGGTFVVRHDFAGSDGAQPQGKLIDGLDSNLYGTTYGGGANGLGTLFRIDQ